MDAIRKERPDRPTPYKITVPNNINYHFNSNYTICNSVKFTMKSSYENKLLTGLLKEPLSSERL